MNDAVREILHRQCGVVSRAQLLDNETSAAVIRGLLRRKELVATVGGVYVEHNGPLTWIQQAWVAVLALWPAALTAESALRQSGGPRGRGSDDVVPVVHVAVDRTRSIKSAPPGVRVHYVSDLDAKVRWNRSPPRVRIEEALIDLAAGARDDMAAIAVLADAVQARSTTAQRLTDTLASRKRVARRRFLAAVLGDIASGAHSALERAYLDRVERAHGLPVGRRQVRGPGVYRDVEYVVHRLRVELDGRLFHDDARARDSDMERDLDSAVDGCRTLRLGWGQVVGRPCATAARVAAVLRQLGWAGAIRTCPSCAAQDRPATT